MQNEVEDGKAEEKGEGAPGLKELLDQERKRSDDLLSRMKYLQADFENYRKRMDKDLWEIESRSVSGLVKKIANVLDELELAVENAGKSGESGSVVEGIKMVYGNLRAALQAEGLQRIEAVGKPFDPEFHEAVEKVEGSSPRDTVVEELRPGYTFRGKVLRPSMVKVELASKKAGKEEGSEVE